MDRCIGYRKKITVGLPQAGDLLCKGWGSGTNTKAKRVLRAYMYMTP